MSTELVKSIDPRTSEGVELDISATTRAELDDALTDALEAGDHLASATPRVRAELLGSMAGALQDDRSAIVDAADRETALGPARLNVELDRCVGQLGHLADVLVDGTYLEATIDHATADQPDVRRLMVPVGVVAVFGASNFPLAFSVPGGDTASALAVGCPVVVKAHPSHPQTCLLAIRALRRGAVAAGFSDRVVSLVFGEPIGRVLVGHGDVSAVGFTGSARAADALQRVIAARERPIPFYGELGSANPLVVTSAAAAERGDEIASDLVGSFTLGNGQFCTKPGVSLVPEEHAAQFVSVLRAELAGREPAFLLNEAIKVAFVERTTSWRESARSWIGDEHPDTAGTSVSAGVLVVDASDVQRDASLLDECFGPVTVVVRYASLSDAIAVLGAVPASLTATVHAATGPDPDAARLLAAVTPVAGRIVWNGYPTGVRVSWAMHHGGGFPAATNPQHTSVGAGAVRRWLRPLAFQGVPQALLPEVLRDSNPLGVPRRVDGTLDH